MSPYNNNDHGAGELRTKFAYLFGTVVEIYRLYHQDEKVAARFEKVVELTQKLYDDEIIDDYLYESLKVVYNHYPYLLPGEVKKGYEENRTKEVQMLNRLYELLTMTQGDLSQRLHDIIMEDNERLKQEWMRRNY